MIRIKRKNFDPLFRHKGKAYRVNVDKNAKATASLSCEISLGNLKGKTDLHGKPYKPSVFYYNEVPEDQVCEIVNGRFSYILKVDGKQINFNGSDTASYFDSHYRSIGYTVFHSTNHEA
jgi:hypothetical protein